MGGAGGGNSCVGTLDSADGLKAPQTAIPAKKAAAVSLSRSADDSEATASTASPEMPP
jgi:hypothetical protein